MKTPIWTSPRTDCKWLTLAGEFDLAALAEFLRSGARPSKGAYFCPVSLVDAKRPARNAGNILSVHALCLDSDEGYTYDQARDVLVRLGHPCIMYRSFSDGIWKNGKPPCDRFRVILLLAIPVEAKGWSDIYPVAARLILPEAPLDMANRDASRAWYFPPHREVEVLCADGELLDVSELRPEPARAIIAPSVSRSARRHVRQGAIRAVFDCACSPDSLAAIFIQFGYALHSMGSWQGLPEIRLVRPGKSRSDGCSLSILPGRTGGAWAHVFSSSIPELPPGNYCASAVVEALCGGQL